MTDPESRQMKIRQMKNSADKAILKKLYIKTVAAAATLIMVITMTVSVTYAWLILSTSPTVSGAEINLAGGNNILLAPDVTETVDGTTVHYPGAFSDKVGLSYEYLKELAGLSPVSTADGLNWIVNEGGSYSVDNTLGYANSKTYRSAGGYVYLDFWVVSPGSDYTLRVSTGTGSAGRGGGNKNDGSSIVEFPIVTGSKESGFTVSEPDGFGTAASIRLGFLVDDSKVEESSNLQSYQASSAYEKRYGTKLLGNYQEPGEELSQSETYKFTIYEPNGTLHKNEADNGCYFITKPLTDAAGNKKDDISDILTVQTENKWNFNGGAAPLDERFQDYVNGTSDDINAKNVMGAFFQNGLGWYVQPYITRGSFFVNTKNLYNAANEGTVGKDEVSALKKAGATDDVYITRLTRNTPQRIRMFIWLEGEDADCKNVSNGTTEFIINLEFSGADQ